MTTVGELKAYIARQQAEGRLTDDSPVVLGLRTGPEPAATLGVGVAANLSMERSLRIGVELNVRALATVVCSACNGMVGVVSSFGDATVAQHTRGRANEICPGSGADIG